jgi:uncharacterized HhH-GPD family protein
VLLEPFGHLDATRIAEHEPEAFAAVMATPPAVHRFPGSMAKRVQDLCRALVENYDGRAEAVWENVTDAAELRRRLEGLPGSAGRRRRSSWRCWASGSASGRTAGDRRPARTAAASCTTTTASPR